MTTLPEPPQLHVVIFENPASPGQFKAFFNVIELYDTAAAKAEEIAAVQRVRSWVMAFPDPRPVAND